MQESTYIMCRLFLRDIPGNNHRLAPRGLALLFDLLDVRQRRLAQMVQDHIGTITCAPCEQCQSCPSSYVVMTDWGWGHVPMATARPIPVEQPVIATTLPGRSFDVTADIFACYLVCWYCG